MTQEDYIELHPWEFSDDLDKWLFKEFGIIGGACSSIESMKYDVAREVAEKAMKYAKEQLMKDLPTWKKGGIAGGCWSGETYAAQGKKPQLIYEDMHIDVNELVEKLPKEE